VLLVLVIINNDFKEQDFNCFLIILKTLFANKAAFVSAELVNKAYAHLLIALINATDPVTEACAHLLTAPTDATGLATEADLFVYSTTAKLYYIFIVFIRIMVNTDVSKKSIISYK
jgi:hypothetical protein